VQRMERKYEKQQRDAPKDDNEKQEPSCR